VQSSEFVVRVSQDKDDKKSLLTVFVRVLNTRTCAVDVPRKTCFPDGSKRATVRADLCSGHKASFSGDVMSNTWACSFALLLQPHLPPHIALLVFDTSSSNLLCMRLQRSEERVISGCVTNDSAQSKHIWDNDSPIPGMKRRGRNGRIEPHCDLLLRRVCLGCKVPHDNIPVLRCR
jgi:hypothetical protein